MFENLFFNVRWCIGLTGMQKVETTPSYIAYHSPPYG